MNNDGVVGVWVTNDPRWLKFVINKLFHKWKIHFIGVWIWLKVTTKGLPAYAFGSNRKSYEQIIVGR